MSNSNRKSQYKRMFETRNIRPYYTVIHLGGFCTGLKELTGFGYRNTIYITSSDMNNTGYFDVNEMKESTKYFQKFWEDEVKTKALIKEVRDRFKISTKVEDRVWTQIWSDKTTDELIEEMDSLFVTLCSVFPTLPISQPAHVIPLEEKLNEVLEGYPEKDKLFMAATYWEKDLPWVDEEREIEKLNAAWEKLARKARAEKIKHLIDEYGWFNAIEGDKPFGAEHYRQKITGFKKETKVKPTVDLPKDAKNIGSLIGELGFLRLWSRYHFMTIRYHLKNVLLELISRTKKPELEFATTEEMGKYFKSHKVDFKEIIRRKKGYASYFKNGKTKIVTGKKADELKKLVKEDLPDNQEIVGRIANKGKAVGKVRIISFIAKNYNQEVASFKQGEILVTGMTKPQIVHLCKMAAAIVTDEGGITSHAAVVSREFGTPCIIATHNATKVLKTGDLVEVDADKGTVRKI